MNSAEPRWRNPDIQAAPDGVPASCSEIERCIQRNPQASILVSLGVGLGVGVLLGTMLGDRRADRDGWLDNRTAESLGRRLMAQIGELVPDTISKRLSD